MNETLWGRTVSCAPIANRRNVRLFALFAASIVAVPAQTFTTLHSFDNADGANPFTGLLQGTDGNLNYCVWRGRCLWNGLQDHPERRPDNHA
jgi:hypothetical protein